MWRIKEPWNKHWLITFFCYCLFHVVHSYEWMNPLLKYEVYLFDCERLLAVLSWLLGYFRWLHSPAVQHLLSASMLSARTHYTRNRLPHKTRSNVIRSTPRPHAASHNTAVCFLSFRLLKIDVSTVFIITDLSQIFLPLLKDFNKLWKPAAACRQMSDINGKKCAWIKVIIFLSVFLLPRHSSVSSKQLAESQCTKQTKIKLIHLHIRNVYKLDFHLLYYNILYIYPLKCFIYIRFLFYLQM